MFIGKSITDLVADKLKVAKDKIKEGGKKIVDKAKEKIQDIKDKGKEVVPTTSRTPEELKEDEAKAKRYIKEFTKKYAHKELTDEQLERISKKMNLPEKLREGTSQWREIIKDNQGNYLRATVQTAMLPGTIGWELMEALQEEGIIDMKEIGLNIV